MINKLVSKIRKTQAPIVVGLDPMLKYVPEHIQKKSYAEYGETLEGAGEALLSSYDRQGGCQGPALRPYEAALFPIN